MATAAIWLTRWADFVDCPGDYGKFAVPPQETAGRICSLTAADKTCACPQTSVFSALVLALRLDGPVWL